MTSDDFDPLAQKARADALVEQAALRLRELLREAVSHLDPFAPFPGALFTYAIEAEPAAISMASVAVWWSAPMASSTSW